MVHMNNAQKDLNYYMKMHSLRQENDFLCHDAKGREVFWSGLCISEVEGWYGYLSTPKEWLSVMAHYTGDDKFEAADELMLEIAEAMADALLRFANETDVVEMPQQDFYAACETALEASLKVVENSELDTEYSDTECTVLDLEFFTL